VVGGGPQIETGGDGSVGAVFQLVRGGGLGVRGFLAVRQLNRSSYSSGGFKKGHRRKGGGGNGGEVPRRGPGGRGGDLAK